MSDYKVLLSKIEKGAHWCVLLRPIKYEREKLSLKECNALMEKCSVRLRGWDYPHLDRGCDGAPHTYDDSVQGYSDAMGHKEWWRLYRSGQFVNKFNFNEDAHITQERWDEIVRTRGITNDNEISGVVSVISTLYRITEIYEFAVRLANNDVFGDAVRIEIECKNITGRVLFFWDVSRDFTFRGAYVAKTPNFTLPHEYNVSDLISKASQYAMNDTIEMLHQFNWFDVSDTVLKEDQRKLLNKAW